ncbi:hypothetical protein CYMTET_29487 [Cymbomonas tetramitiformis]|uniref:Uncharacterized protein n=1 Tax=Cymbomonas tetramitiformis TaxID=36881 RepID=A0AAE0FKY6_9CHLO|nr:hypothetical protein CYMTET_29487 [Cymbomonas tetramitiformis]
MAPPTDFGDKSVRRDPGVLVLLTGNTVHRRERLLNTDSQKLRIKKRSETGWACEPQTPYKPLGTPDLDRHKPYRYDDASFLSHRDPSSRLHLHDRKEQEGERKDEKTLQLPSIEPPPSPNSENGFSSLRKALQSSHSRVRRCRNGSQFHDCIRKSIQEAPVPRIQADGLRPLEPLNIPFSTVDSLNSAANGSGADAAGPSSDNSELSGPQLVPRPPVGMRPRQNLSKPTPSESLPEEPDDSQDFATLLESMDPHNMLHASRQVFNDSKKALNNNLYNALDELYDMREDIYKRKFMSFHSHRKLFSSKKWQKEAGEWYGQWKNQLIEKHEWFPELHQYTKSLHGPNAAFSAQTQRVIEHIKNAIQTNQGEYFVDDFLDLCLVIKKDTDTVHMDPNSPQVKICLFIREQLDVPHEDFRRFLQMHNPVLMHAVRDIFASVKPQPPRSNQQLDSRPQLEPIPPKEGSLTARTSRISQISDRRGSATHR